MPVVECDEFILVDRCREHKLAGIGVPLISRREYVSDFPSVLRRGQFFWICWSDRVCDVLCEICGCL